MSQFDRSWMRLQELKMDGIALANMVVERDSINMASTHNYSGKPDADEWAIILGAARALK